ncbi:MAG: hypothetical protein QXF26_01370 [Candidatus Bathyarchaeia archaeon]
MSKYWKPQPLHTSIVELLNKKQGLMMDVELHKALLEVYGDLSMSDLNKALMKLEVEGILRVSGLTKSKRRVELAKDNS